MKPTLMPRVVKIDGIWIITTDAGVFAYPGYTLLEILEINKEKD